MSESRSRTKKTAPAPAKKGGSGNPAQKNVALFKRKNGAFRMEKNAVPNSDRYLWLQITTSKPGQLLDQTLRLIRRKKFRS